MHLDFDMKCKDPKESLGFSNSCGSSCLLDFSLYDKDGELLIVVSKREYLCK